MDRWCWASVAQLILRAFGIYELQCRIAEKYNRCDGKVLNCCPHSKEPIHADCDRTQDIGKVLGCFGVLDDQQKLGDIPDPFLLVDEKLRQGRPVCIQLINGPLEHFCVITGISPTTADDSWIELQNPADGSRVYLKFRDVLGGTIDDGYGSARVAYLDWTNILHVITSKP